MTHPPAPTSAAALIDTALQHQRRTILQTLELADHPLIVEGFAKNLFPSWNDYLEVETTAENRRILARAMMEGDPQRRAPVLLHVSDYSRGVAEQVLELCHAEDIPVRLWVDDPVFKRRVLIAGGPEKAARYGDLVAQTREGVGRQIGFSMTTPHFDFPDPEPKELNEIFDKAHAARREQYTPELFYTATRIPTQSMAEADGMAYEELIDIYFRMIGVDMAQVAAAHRVLIDKLDRASRIRFVNDDGTDLSMSIKGFTFVNSLMAKNVPGSEVFSAPEKFSAQGRLVAKGKFTPPHAPEMIENITLDFVDGRVVAHHADSGMQALTDYLDTDEGTRYLGEVALGTNPALRRHVTNSLMVEKVGLSFHVALGRAYTYTDYIGTPVIVDNGNRSARHWDITTMLYGKNGRIILDDEILMEGGFYTDPRLAYLNGEKE